MTVNEELEYRKKVKAKLDSVGKGFCLAKWNQVTIHLGCGLTHSCHHAVPHKISESEIKRNPSALHNTLYKKKMRHEMLNGKRPKECDYCWRIEDSSDQFSDRIFKSSEPWAFPTFDKVLNTYWSDDYFPTYVEVDFSNKCNQKCMYCNPQFSSAWQKEAEKFGPIDLGEGTCFNGVVGETEKNLYNHPENNPYIKAFWKWWPDLFKHLHTFRMTGGEPLLEPTTYELLRYIQEHWEENPNISLGLNTNLNLSDEKLEELLEILSDLSNNNKVRELIIYTSAESTGKHAEYARFGMNDERLWKHIERIVQVLPKVTLTMMACFNITSVYTYKEVIDRVWELKKKYHGNNGSERIYGTSVMLDTAYIRWPDVLSIKQAGPKEIQLIKELGEYVEQYRTESTPEAYPPGFCEVEIEKIKRLYDYVVGPDPYDLPLKRRQLKKFFEELDRRRGTDYKGVFPELAKLLVGENGN